MTLPPPLVMQASGRDLNSIDLKYIRVNIKRNNDEDSHLSHKFEDLDICYTSKIVHYYDIILMGFRESATLLISEILRRVSQNQNLI